MVQFLWLIGVLDFSYHLLTHFGCYISVLFWTFFVDCCDNTLLKLRCSFFFLMYWRVNLILLHFWNGCMILYLGTGLLSPSVCGCMWIACHLFNILHFAACFLHWTFLHLLLCVFGILGPCFDIVIALPKFSCWFRFFCSIHTLEPNTSSGFLLSKKSFY